MYLHENSPRFTSIAFMFLIVCTVLAVAPGIGLAVAAVLIIWDRTRGRKNREFLDRRRKNWGF
jgi:hypothetical protein